MSGAPAISVVIPARDAAVTLAETLASLVAQSFRDWEAVIVDDGSRDATGAIAAEWASADDRFRLIATGGVGVASARNAGIADARGAMLLLLDADDWIAPGHLAALTAAADEADIGYSGYRRVTAAGAPLAPSLVPQIADDPFLAFADHANVAIHCVLAPRRLVEQVGGFDRALPTCEDWDLWLRLARLGTRWRCTGEATAFYRMRAGSLSADYGRMAADGLEVIARARRPDPRLPATVPVASGGGVAATHYFLWCAAAAAAAGQGRDRWPQLVFADLAGAAPAVRASFADALAVGAQVEGGGLLGAWNVARAALLPLLAELEAASAEPGLARRVAYGLELPLLRAATAPAEGETVIVAEIDLDRPTPIVPTGAQDLLLARLVHRGELLMRAEVPLYGALSARGAMRLAIELLGLDAVLARATPAGFRRRLRRAKLRALPGTVRAVGFRPWRVRQRLERLREPVLLACHSDAAPSSSDGERARIIAAARAAASADPLPRTPPAAAPPRAGTDMAGWDAFYAAVDPWRYEHPHEVQKHDRTLDLAGAGSLGRVLELGCGEGHFTARLVGRAASLLATDISAVALARARERVGEGAEFALTDLAGPLPPGPFDTVFCSEALYYLDAASLPEVGGRLRDVLGEGGRLVMSNIHLLDDDPARTGFDADLAFGGDGIAAVMDAVPGLARARTLRAGSYRIDVWQRGPAGASPVEEEADCLDPAPEVAAGIVWGGAVARRMQLFETIRTERVPILMYHRVAEDGPAALAPWRLSAARFEAQLRLLRRHGFYSLSLAAFDWYRARGEAIPGRPVILSFDDAYRDFAATAWPILRANGFSAELFVVTDKVGTAADWDRGFGDPAPLADWAEIAALADAGVGIGSHLASHRIAEGLGSAELLAEAARSRAALESRLGQEVIAVAAPFGNIDERAVRIFHEAGYRVGLTTAWGTAELAANPLALPRITVDGAMSLAAFADALGIAT